MKNKVSREELYAFLSYAEKSDIAELVIASGSSHNKAKFINIDSDEWLEILSVQKISEGNVENLLIYIQNKNRVVMKKENHLIKIYVK